MIFPESMEDIYLIVDMYEMTEYDVETCVDSLTAFIDELESSSSGFVEESDDLDNHYLEAQQYSDECLLLCKELSSHVRYDVTLGVALEDLAWECVLAANLAEELQCQVEELNRLADMAQAHCDAVRAYRDLLQKYLGRNEEEEDDDWRS